MTGAIVRHLLAQCPLIAIVRGITPAECEAIGDALYEGGIRIIEVPLNSPDALVSIERLSNRFGERALIGAGTVLRPDQVLDVAQAGGRIIVSPAVNVEVIRTSVAAGLFSCPGYFTPSEAFAALDAGAHALKLFPAEGASPAVSRRSEQCSRATFGSSSSAAWAPTRCAVARSRRQRLRVGSGIYKPGQTPEQTLEKARAFVAG